MEITERSPDTLNRPEGNDLQSNYEAHDCASEHVLSTLEAWGLYAEDWGIDMRENEENLIFDDKMDMKVRNGADELCAFLDIKSKRSDGWFGVFNRRHLHHYQDIAEKTQLPVVVWMCRVTTDDSAVLYDSIIPIGNSPQHEPNSGFRAPDGNAVVKFDEEQQREPQWFCDAIEAQYEESIGGESWLDKARRVFA